MPDDPLEHLLLLSSVYFIMANTNPFFNEKLFFKQKYVFFNKTPVVTKLISLQKIILKIVFIHIFNNVSIKLSIIKCFFIALSLYPLSFFANTPIKYYKVNIENMKRDWVFATNSNLLIPLSLQPDGANLWYFKLRLFYL